MSNSVAAASSSQYVLNLPSAMRVKSRQIDKATNIQMEGCPLKGQPVRKNRSVRFGFCGATVQVVSSGDPVSFNTTVGDVWVEEQ